MGRPIDAAKPTKIIPGQPNPEFTRRRPMTWNMSETENDTPTISNQETTPKLSTNPNQVGIHIQSRKPAYLDEKTKLFFVDDARSPKNKHYITKSSIEFI